MSNTTENSTPCVIELSSSKGEDPTLVRFEDREDGLKKARAFSKKYGPVTIRVYDLTLVEEVAK